jgi:drug/metabolite transporter (DMT)-like permease
MDRRAIVFLSLGAIWGSNWMAIKIELQDVSPFAFAASRFALAAATLMVVILVRRIPLPRSGRDWGAIAAMGIAVLLGAVVLGERLDVRTALGATVVVSGFTVALYRRRPRPRLEPVRID